MSSVKVHQNSRNNLLLVTGYPEILLMTRSLSALTNGLSVDIRAREIITKEMNRIIHFKPNLRYILLACVKVVREAGRGSDFQLDNKIQPYVCK